MPRNKLSTTLVRSPLLGNLPLIIAEIRLERRTIQKSAAISGLATTNVLKSIRQVAAPYPHSCPVGGSAISAPDLIVVLALICFVIAADINPDEPSAVVPCDDLANLGFIS